MKNILNYKKYLELIKEADETLGAKESEDENDNSDKENNNVELMDGEELSEDDPSKKSVQFLPRFSSAVTKDFFRELKKHIEYWFNYGELSKEYEIYDIKNNKTSVEFWFNDKKEDNNPVFQWCVKYREVEPEGKIVQIEKVLLDMKLYDYDTNELLKTFEVKIRLENVNDNFLHKKIKKLIRDIIISPNSKKDVKRFNRKELKNLKDNIY